MMPLKNYWLVPVLGLILGLFGVLYNLCVDKAQNLYDKIKIPYIKTAIPFMLAGILGFVWPAVLGGGHGLIAGLTGQTALWGLLGLLAVRSHIPSSASARGYRGGVSCRCWCWARWRAAWWAGRRPPSGWTYIWRIS